jgi:hypothetical protein
METTMKTQPDAASAGLSPEEELIAGLMSDPELRRVVSNSSLTEENFERGTGLRGAFRFAMAGPEWIEKALRGGAGTTSVQVQRLAPLGIHVSPQRAELLVRRIMDKVFDQEPVAVPGHRDDRHADHRSGDDRHRDEWLGDGRDDGEECNDERRDGHHADHGDNRASTASTKSAGAIEHAQGPSPRKDPKIEGSDEAHTTKIFSASPSSASVLAAPISFEEAAAWARQVLGDPKLPASAAKVAWCILTNINRRTGIALPSITTIAHQIAMSSRTVVDALQMLRFGQHLAVERNSGKANQYRLLLKAPPETPATKVEGLHR